MVISTILDDLHASLTGADANIFLQEVGSMKLSIMPRSGALKEEDRKKLAYILPEYFSGESKSG
jgi:5'-methylthioadenosine phosphorylase